MARGGKRKGAGRKSNESMGLAELESVSAKVTVEAKEFLEATAARKGQTVSELIVTGLGLTARGFKTKNKRA